MSLKKKSLENELHKSSSVSAVGWAEVGGYRPIQGPGQTSESEGEAAAVERLREEMRKARFAVAVAEAREREREAIGASREPVEARGLDPDSLLPHRRMEDGEPIVYSTADYEGRPKQEHNTMARVPINERIDHRDRLERMGMERVRVFLNRLFDVPGFDPGWDWEQLEWRAVEENLRPCKLLRVHKVPNSGTFIEARVQVDALAGSWLVDMLQPGNGVCIRLGGGGLS